VHGASLVQQNIIIAEELRSPIVIKLESRRLEKTLEVLDNHLQGREYLLKSGFSAIDTSVGYSIHMGSMFTNISDFKNIKNYYDKLKNRAAFKKSLPKDINDPLKNIKAV
jgi:glutathione S-transferase